MCNCTGNITGCGSPSCTKKASVCKPNCCPDGEFNTNCIVYNKLPNRSKLLCFLGLDNNTTLTKILEGLDSKLCIKPSQCAKLKFGFGCDAGIDTVIYKLLDYLCVLEDTKVKITAQDISGGFLFDKIETGPCISKIMVQDVNGNQKIRFELDFTCIKNNLPV
jgi:hypothetical protein